MQLNGLVTADNEAGAGESPAVASIKCFTWNNGKIMKWYSIKKYKPPTSSDLLLRIEKKACATYRYARYIVASLECFPNDDEIFNIYAWEISNGAQLDIDLEAYQVTHFCIPGPIEIEELIKMN